MKWISNCFFLNVSLGFNINIPRNQPRPQPQLPELLNHHKAGDLETL